MKVIKLTIKILCLCWFYWTAKRRLWLLNFILMQQFVVCYFRFGNFRLSLPDWVSFHTRYAILSTSIQNSTRADVLTLCFNLEFLSFFLNFFFTSACFDSFILFLIWIFLPDTPRNRFFQNLEKFVNEFWRLGTRTTYIASLYYI
jgi:hypothetical protein